MAFAHWTFSGDASGALDTSIKYAGNSSYKSTLSGSTGNTNNLTHDTFLEPQLQIILWSRWYCADSGSPYNYRAKPRIILSSYGTLDLGPHMSISTWEKFRVTFWYDVSSNSKFGRIEKWSGSAWEQQGSDKNFGAGSPSAGTLALNGYVTANRTSYVWFDEVEVYS